MSMKELTALELTEASGGRLLMGDGNVKVKGFLLDSRKREEQVLFVPIIGEKVDAHQFICQALNNGAAAVFTSRHHSLEDIGEAIDRQCGSNQEMRERSKKAVWIQVEDTVKALQEVGAHCRRKLQIPLVGITGSVGKTTTREMISAALSAGFTVYQTPGNCNSQVGVPITIAQIPESAGIGVIELGMSEPGEMTRIARVAQVDCAVMTNIGVTHIEQLGSRENILKEKLHIQDGMAPEGRLFLNGDDELLKDVTPEDGRKKILYGLNAGCHYRGEDLHLENGYPIFTAVHGGERVTVSLKVMGSHMVSNALAALAVAGEYGIPMAQAAVGVEGFEGFDGRQQVFEWGGVTVIDDSYNASPVSMKGALEVLHSMEGKSRKIAVLADMKELGAEAIQYHREIGDYIAGRPVDKVLLLGGLAAEIGREMEKNGASRMVSIVYCEELSQVNRWMDENAAQGDCILFKGSNSMRLSQAVKHLRENKTEVPSL